MSSAESVIMENFKIWWYETLNEDDRIWYLKMYKDAISAYNAEVLGKK
jgi:hypothetical protein